ncbi:hypothetical protein [Weissella cibaria]|uniref:Uncharacterized protein n=1 Tax=Weissella cibaria TaxID=137591 RepID=A0A2S1KQV1_9LACO|nr:hypothetical protein [Weissella cibaria]AWF95366.1 hypothetical protein B6254_0960 [Weissella cibaria]
MKFKKYAPNWMTLTSFVFGVFVGIGLLSVFVNQPLDWGNLSEWIGSLSTIVAGIWAVQRFSLSRQEKFEVTLPRVDVMTRKGSEEPVGVIDSYQIKVVNKIERPTSIVSVGGSVFLDEQLNEFVYSVQFNIDTTHTHLEFDDFMIANLSFETLMAFWQGTIMTVEYDSQENKQSKSINEWLDKLQNAKSFVLVPYVEFAINSEANLFGSKKIVINLSDLQDDIKNASKVKQNIKAVRTSIAL